MRSRARTLSAALSVPALTVFAIGEVNGPALRSNSIGPAVDYSVVASEADPIDGTEYDPSGRQN
ncbi:hypothetical protein [Qipengyuania psychrotolerans]|uniref:Uncharacterized protein n=1 Tax=Qipengyuania psychrotolerans TaxID=2867238 RepID=A0ABX8ZGX3_9SPHN|nr:hypothetical protein [Qipengyuania psychrotolerans]QZD88260.1 hypothetical protein K3166_06225 [Qipengyuania psychrotolerans]